jgi:hypothetical protein
MTFSPAARAAHDKKVTARKSRHVKKVHAKKVHHAKATTAHHKSSHVHK